MTAQVYPLVRAIASPAIASPVMSRDFLDTESRMFLDGMSSGFLDVCGGGIA
ncbi:hypothetical protein ACUXA5_002547, partial [Corynebacterium hesseae]